jgi:SPP1 family predicted phage head-tail adaptor
MIRPGELRERVTIQTPNRTTNSLGEAIVSWDSGATIWASVNGVSSREALEYGQQTTSVSHRLRFRYVSGLTHQDRFLWRGRILDIVSLLEYENRSEHVALCEEQV